MLGQSEQVYVAAVPSPHTPALQLHVAMRSMSSLPYFFKARTSESESDSPHGSLLSRVSECNGRRTLVSGALLSSSLTLVTFRRATPRPGAAFSRVRRATSTSVPRVQPCSAWVTFQFS